MNGLITLIATPVATVLKAIHALLSTFLAPSSGPAWGLSIVLLTVCVRLVLFPLFVKQIKSQRRMQELAPKIKELQARHKGDRETLNTELMKLYKDNNANPISGCLPLILQLPVFFALFSVIREFRPDKSGNFHSKYGLPHTLIEQAAHAKVFGAPISAAFNSKAGYLHELGGSAGVVKSVALIMIVLMGATTFWTQRQMMARAGAAADPQQQQIQKFMLYVLPLSFAVFGINFPIGVLLYWLTTNLWSMGQQHYVIKRMPPVVAGAGGATASAGRGSKATPAKGVPAAKVVADEPEPAPEAAPALTTGGATAAGAPGAKRTAGSRKNKRKGGRR